MKHESLNPEDAERRSRLIYSYYRPFGMKKRKEDIAREAGYTPEYLARLFSGERRVSDEAAKNLANALGVRAEYLLLKDEYMTPADFDQAMTEADSLGKAINHTAIAKDFFNTGVLPESISDLEKINEDVVTFINNSHAEGKRLLVNIKEKKYIQMDDDTYKSLCDEIADYIEFKLQQLYRNSVKKELNE